MSQSPAKVLLIESPTTAKVAKGCLNKLAKVRSLRLKGL